jgi:uncharacterized protein (TIGR03435 family)
MPPMRGALWVIVLVLLIPISGIAQSPRFDVVSIKLHTTGPETVRWTFENGRFTSTNVTLQMLVSTAYGPPQQPLPDFLITGAPGWSTTDRFDVNGTTMSDAALPVLLRDLLETRFSLKSHFATREMPIYALVLARRDGMLGPNLRRVERDCAAIAAGRVAGEPCGGQIHPGQVSARGVTMTQIVSGLARLMPGVERPVRDRTGLSGSFDMDLTWTPDRPVVGPTPDTPIAPIDPNSPSLFTALQEQLGLKLEPQRGQVDVLVIDSVSMPETN